MSGLTVWRDKPGSTVATYAKFGSRLPLILKKDEGQEVVYTPADELRPLVAGREPFAPVHITQETAEEVLGWKVETL